MPVINGLTQRSHPCQVMADVMTFEEHRGSIGGRTVAWTGDANNVLASWMHAAERFNFDLRVATPPELKPKKWLLDWVKESGAAVRSAAIRRRRSRAPIASSPTPGCRWATRTAIAATTCSSPIRSTRG